MVPDLLNYNSIIFVSGGERLEEINRIFDKCHLRLPIPFIKEKNWYDTLSKVYVNALENGLEFVTCFSMNAYPRLDIIEKFNNEFKDFDDEWGIISWSRTGDISGWYPGDIKNFNNERRKVDVSKNIITRVKPYNNNLIIIPHFSFGFDAFSIQTDSFPLFLDRINSFQHNPDLALANDDYQGFVKTYHTKDLYFCHYDFRSKKWQYPLTYNENRLGFCGNSTTTPPEGFSIL